VLIDLAVAIRGSMRSSCCRRPKHLKGHLLEPQKTWIVSYLIGITLFFIICRNRDVVLFMKANKSIIIDIDSFLHDFVEEFTSKGLMPTIKQLMKKGAYGYALPSMKTYLNFHRHLLSCNNSCFPPLHDSFSPLQLPSEPNAPPSWLSRFYR